MYVDYSTGVLTHLLLVREDAADDDVVEGLLGVEAEALSDALDALGTKVALRVYIIIHVHVG